jgi:hypothetical protein
MIEKTNPYGKDNRNVHHDPKTSPYDRYVQIVLGNEAKPEPKNNVRIDTFMKRHVGASFHSFIDSARPEEIVEDDYGLFKRGSIKRSLFETRARVYLEALCDFEEQGGDIQQALDAIRYGDIPIVKKHSGKEPTLEAIYEALKTHSL